MNGIDLLINEHKYVSRMFLNFAFIPFILVYAFIFILSYFPQLFIGLL